MDGTRYNRRQVLTGGLVGLGALVAESSLSRLGRRAFAAETCAPGAAGPGWASPLEAMKAPREQFLYTSCHYSGTGINQPAKSTIRPPCAACHSASGVLRSEPVIAER